MAGGKASVSDCVNNYSHTHDISDIRTVYLKKTAIADHARSPTMRTVLAAEHVGKDGMVSAMALAAREATPVFVYQPWGLVWEITSFPHS